MMPGARSVALEAVRRVVEDGGYSTLVIPAALARSGLDVRDRAFAADLAFGTLRHLRSIDWAIEQRANRPIARMSPTARDTLRLGAHQLLFSRVPAHAAVGETVALAQERERGFVNAVLRRLASDPPPWPSGSAERDVSVRTGLEVWAIRELGHLLAADEVEPAAEAFAGRALLGLRTNTCATTTDALEDALRGAGRPPVRSAIHRDCLLVDGGDPAVFPGWDEGWFVVQDQASAFVTAALDPQPGERVLDACAGPGGKAAHIACLVGPHGRVVAADVHPRRAALVRAAADRLGLRPWVLSQDATAPALRPTFDRVLVDAPCSGIGAARRRPELLWRPRRDELSRLARLQVAIAVASAELLAPGGRLVYSVCTFPRAETDAACDAILRHRRDLKPAVVDGPDGSAPRVRLWPHRHGADGMFVAAFTKRG